MISAHTPETRTSLQAGEGSSASAPEAEASLSLSQLWDEEVVVTERANCSFATIVG